MLKISAIEPKIVVVSLIPRIVTELGDTSFAEEQPLNDRHQMKSLTSNSVTELSSASQKLFRNCSL